MASYTYQTLTDAGEAVTVKAYGFRRFIKSLEKLSTLRDELEPANDEAKASQRPI